MNELFWAVLSGGTFALAALLISGAAAGEYHDVESAVVWVSSVANIA